MQEPDLALLEDAAREAGKIACKYWREDPQVWDKGGDDPVSEADFAVNSYLGSRLIDERPDYGWVSEETEDNAARLAANRVFIVDPIDGTRAFVAGEPTWAHSLAIVENGETIAACVYLPVPDKMYLSSLNHGATLNGLPLKVGNQPKLSHSKILTPKVTLQERFWKSGAPEFQRHFRPSLAYRLSLVAEGRFDGMITLRATWDWDIAAGVLIAKEAGARVSDRNGKTPIFNSVARQSAGIVAASSSIHSQIIDRLA